MTVSPPYTIRYMLEEDVGQVAAIELASFEMPWSPLAYIYEINQNPNAHMTVVEGLAEHKFFGSRVMPIILAFGGLWHRGNYGHISTIASHPDYRGRGFGEMMLIGLIGKAMALGTMQVGLDVRVSNLRAQSLYTKYEFQIARIQPGYYRNNNEDAYLMVVPALDEAYRQTFRQRVIELQKRVHFQDEFSGLQLENIHSNSLG